MRSATLPQLLIRSEVDKDINAALASTLTALDEAPDGRVVPLADAGHFANMEQPQRFAAILQDFLNDAEGRTTAAGATAAARLHA